MNTPVASYARSRERNGVAASSRNHYVFTQLTSSETLMKSKPHNLCRQVRLCGRKGFIECSNSPRDLPVNNAAQMPQYTSDPTDIAVGDVRNYDTGLPWQSIDCKFRCQYVVRIRANERESYSGMNLHYQLHKDKPSLRYRLLRVALSHHGAMSR